MTYTWVKMLRCKTLQAKDGYQQYLQDFVKNQEVTK